MVTLFHIRRFVPGIALALSFVQVVFIIALTHFLGINIEYYYHIIIAAFLVVVNALVYMLFIRRFINKSLAILFKSLSSNADKFYDLTKEFGVDGKEVLDEINKKNKDSEEELENLRIMTEYRKEFIGNVSHELKTPIFNIQGYILTLLEGGMYDEEINMSYLRKSEKNINRMISIVEDLERITRLESGRLVLEPREFHVEDFITDIFDTMEDVADQKSIRLRLINKCSNGSLVLADRENMKQVFSNLIINAVNYGKPNGMVEVTITEEGEKVFVEVKDDGIGMSKENVARIFERFFRVDKSRSTKYGGTGLGLSIVKHVIEAHNEEIKVISDLGVGTTFTVSLTKPSK